MIDDAFRWLREQPAQGFDAVIVDLPDPDTPVLARLYSTEFYGLVATTLNPGGLLVVQAGSPYSTPTAYWRTVSTVASAGLAVTPYHVHVPSFGDWGFALAQAGAGPPELRISPQVPELRFLNDAVLEAAAVFPATAARNNWPLRRSTSPGSCRTCGRATRGGELAAMPILIYRLWTLMNTRLHGWRLPSSSLS